MFSQGSTRADAKAWSVLTKILTPKLMPRRKFRHTTRFDPAGDRSHQEYILNQPAQLTTRSEFLRLIRGGEDTYLELKVKLSNPERITQGIVALANTSGGTIIFGVNDQFRIEGAGRSRIGPRRACPALPRRDRAAGRAAYRYDRVRQRQTRCRHRHRAAKQALPNTRRPFLYAVRRRKKGSRPRTAFDVARRAAAAWVREYSACSTATKAILTTACSGRLPRRSKSQSEHQSLSNRRILEERPAACGRQRRRFFPDCRGRHFVR